MVNLSKDDDDDDTLFFLVKIIELQLTFDYNSFSFNSYVSDSVYHISHFDNDS